MEMIINGQFYSCLRDFELFGVAADNRKAAYRRHRAAAVWQMLCDIYIECGDSDEMDINYLLSADPVIYEIIYK